jgi:hypothetical protein
VTDNKEAARSKAVDDAATTAQYNKNAAEYVASALRAKHNRQNQAPVTSNHQKQAGRATSNQEQEIPPARNKKSRNRATSNDGDEVLPIMASPQKPKQKQPKIRKVYRVKIHRSLMYHISKPNQ